MGTFTLRNVAVAGLVQVAVVVAGVLAAGACCRWAEAADLSPPRRTVLLAEYGHIGLLLPLAWSAGAALTLRRSEAEGVEAVILASGALLALAILAVAGHAAAMPLFRLMGGGCGFSLAGRPACPEPWPSTPTFWASRERQRPESTAIVLAVRSGR